jgi:hypothetical protein
VKRMLTSGCSPLLSAWATRWRASGRLIILTISTSQSSWMLVCDVLIWEQLCRRVHSHNRLFWTNSINAWLG